MSVIPKDRRSMEAVPVAGGLLVSTSAIRAAAGLRWLYNICGWLRIGGQWVQSLLRGDCWSQHLLDPGCGRFGMIVKHLRMVQHLRMVG